LESSRPSKKEPFQDRESSPQREPFQRLEVTTSRGYAPELDMPKGAQLIDGPAQARKAAREQLDHGSNWLKVYMTHRSWVDKQGNLVSQPTLTLEELGQIRNASALIAINFHRRNSR